MIPARFTLGSVRKRNGVLLLLGERYPASQFTYGCTMLSAVVLVFRSNRKEELLMDTRQPDLIVDWDRQLLRSESRKQTSVFHPCDFSRY